MFNLRPFAYDNRGNIAPLFALMLVPVAGITSMAIDMGRAMNARTTVQAAADIAALTAVRSPNATESERIAAAVTAFSANLGSQNSDPAEIVPTVTYSNGTITVSAAGSVRTTLAQLLGLTQLDYAAQSSASIASGKQLELAMMIDLTGSMGELRNGQTKIAGLKDAANDMLAILFPNNATTSSNVRIGVAPFADYVNAGVYSDDATGLSATGGSYSNIYNLASTRQGRFYGNYTGAIGNTSPVGQTSPTGYLNAAGTMVPVSTTSAGATYSNGYCATPTVTTTGTVGVEQISGRNAGIRLPRATSNNGNTYWTGAPPAGMLNVPSNTYISWFNEYWNYGWKYYDGNYDQSPQARDNTYYIPLVQDPTGLTIQQRTAKDSNNTTRTGDVGYAIWFDQSSSQPRIKRNNSSNGNGFWHVSQVNVDGSLSYQWVSSTSSSSNQTSWYIPLYTNLNITQTSTVAGCETPVVSQPSSKLITCVTERSGPNAYTDAGPGTAYVGAYSAGNNAQSNYSSDGKCWVAGRELPSIIPLTNTKSTLTDFFANATVGGATPGHIGTAWAWYLLSPNWSTVWPSASQPTAYNNANVLKVAVLMTDGEYNIHYQSATARDQALALCTNMKAAGITVYTIGFGFSTSATASATGTTEQRAKDLLTQCASGSNKYFFPYDGAAMRTAFQNIGSQLMDALNVTTSKLTN